VLPHPLFTEESGYHTGLSKGTPQKDRRKTGVEMHEMPRRMDEGNYVQEHQRALEDLGLTYEGTVDSKELYHWTNDKDKNAIQVTNKFVRGGGLREEIESLTLYLDKVKADLEEPDPYPTYEAGEVDGKTNVIDDVQSRLFNMLASGT
jgi:hypothetical protein